MDIDYPHIQVTKLGQCADPKFATAATHAEYRENIYRRYALSPNEGYTVKGFLAFPIKVGSFVLVGRYERNGETVGGTFRSSVVTKHDEEKKIFETQNSVYSYEILPVDEEAKKMFDKMNRGEL